MYACNVHDDVFLFVNHSSCLQPTYITNFTNLQNNATLKRGQPLPAESHTSVFVASIPTQHVEYDVKLTLTPGTTTPNKVPSSDFRSTLTASYYPGPGCCSPGLVWWECDADPAEVDCYIGWDDQSTQMDQTRAATDNRDTQGFNGSGMSGRHTLNDYASSTPEATEVGQEDKTDCDNDAGEVSKLLEPYRP